MNSRQPSRTPSTRGVGIGQTVGTNAAVSLGKGPALTRDLRLSQVVAVLAEHDMPRDRHGDADDPWPDIPEELYPLDEDAADDEDILYDRRRRRRPAIVYSAAGRWAPPPDATPVGGHEVTGDLRISVNRPVVGPDDDAAASDLVADELQRIARALDEMQSRALRASSRLEAYDALEVTSAAKLATRAKVSASLLARRRRETVEAPWGVVPLEFFWWKRAVGLRLVEAQLLAELVRATPSAEARTAAHAVAERVAAPEDVAGRTEAMRKQVPIMRAMLPLLPTLELMSRALTDIDPDAVDDMIDAALRAESGQALDNRGRGLVRFALCGAFASLAAQS